MNSHIGPLFSPVFPQILAGNELRGKAVLFPDIKKLAGDISFLGEPHRAIPTFFSFLLFRVDGRGMVSYPHRHQESTPPTSKHTQGT